MLLRAAPGHQGRAALPRAVVLQHHEVREPLLRNLERLDWSSPLVPCSATGIGRSEGARLVVETPPAPKSRCSRRARHRVRRDRSRARARTPARGSAHRGRATAPGERLPARGAGGRRRVPGSATRPRPESSWVPTRAIRRRARRSPSGSRTFVLMEYGTGAIMIVPATTPGTSSSHPVQVAHPRGGTHGDTGCRA